MAQSVEERGWQIGRTLTECLEHMLTNELRADVTFSIRPPSSRSGGVQLSAHKLILCARSPVFEAMFSGKFAESNDRVTIVDAEPEPFKEMLRYVNSITLIELMHQVFKQVSEHGCTVRNISVVSMSYACIQVFTLQES